MDEQRIQYEVEILQAIGHVNRLKILYALLGGRKCSCDLVDELHMEQSNLSRHLAKMVKAGILIRYQLGGRVEYEIASERINELLELVQQVAYDRLRKIIALYENEKKGAILKKLEASGD